MILPRYFLQLLKICTPLFSVGLDRQIIYGSANHPIGEPFIGVDWVSRGGIGRVWGWQSKGVMCGMLIAADAISAEATSADQTFAKVTFANGPPADLIGRGWVGPLRRLRESRTRRFSKAGGILALSHFFFPAAARCMYICGAVTTCSGGNDALSSAIRVNPSTASTISNPSTCDLPDTRWSKPRSTISSGAMSSSLEYRHPPPPPPPP